VPGTPHGTGTAGALDDLDAAALDYAGRRATAPAHTRPGLRDDLIRYCIPFADRMARRYAGHSEPLEDLVQVARLGLVKAVDRYDPARGSFTAYSVITIRGELKRHFRDRTWGMHVSRRMQDLSREVRRATASLAGDLARDPTDAEIAGHLRVDERDVRLARQTGAGHTQATLSTPLDADGGAELADVLGGTDQAIEDLPDRLTVESLLHRMPQRVRRVITMRFHGNLTQAQIATEIGVSQMQVSRLLTQGLTWLRAAMLSDAVPPWPGMDPCPAGPAVQVHVVRGAATVTARVTGEADRDAVDRLREPLHSAVAMAAARPLTVDLGGVPLMDAAGAAVLRDVCVRAALAGVAVRLVGVQPYVAPVLATVGLSPYTLCSSPQRPDARRRPGT
jgi:RNA polymerase sigma-B factor